MTTAIAEATARLGDRNRHPGSRIGHRAGDKGHGRSGRPGAGRRNHRPIAETISALLETLRAHAGIALWPNGEQALANCRG